MRISRLRSSFSSLTLHVRRETDDARIAASQTVGLLVQYIVSFVASLVLSLYRSYLLTFVILASVPLIILVVAVTERMATPLSDKDREFTDRKSVV